MAAFGVVGEADELAHSLGEPYGTLILTLSIVSIEVILIAAVMMGPNEAPTIGRDSIFAVMMIILNLVTGGDRIAGEYAAQSAMRHHDCFRWRTGGDHHHDAASGCPLQIARKTGDMLWPR